MANSGTIPGSNNSTKEFHKLNYANLLENLDPDKPEETRLGAACFLLGIELKELIETPGQDSNDKKEKREKELKRKYRLAQLRLHPDKNPEARDEASELTKLCNRARDLLTSFIERDCNLTSSHESSNAQFWDDYKASQKKYQTQYVFATDDPYYFSSMAQATNSQFTFRQNWDIEEEEIPSQKKPEEETSVAVYEERLVPKLKTTGPKQVNFYGPEAFFKALTSFSLPRRFGQWHLSTALAVKSEEEYALMGREGRDRAYTLIKKCLTTPYVIDFMDTSDWLRLAKDATRQKIIDIGTTDLEIFIWYLKHFPQTLYPRRIERIIDSITKEGGYYGEVSLENLKTVVNTLLADPAILYGLSSSCLIKLVESCGDEGTKIAAAILKDKVLSNNLEETSHLSSHRRKLAEVLTNKDLDDSLKIASREMLTGNSLWQGALTKDANRRIEAHLKAFDVAATLYPVTEEKEEEEAAVHVAASQYILLPEMHALKLIYFQKNKELSHFNTGFLYEKFKDNHFELFHLNLAKHFIEAHESEKGKEILQGLIQTYCSEEEKENFTIQLENKKVDLNAVYELVKKSMTVHADTMIDKFIEHLKLQFREYIKNPESSKKMLDAYRDQFKLIGKEEIFNTILNEEKLSLKKSLFSIILKNEPVDRGGIKLEKVEDVQFYAEKIRDYFKDAHFWISGIVGYLCDEIKSFAGIERSINRYDSDMEEFLTDNNIDLHNLEKIRDCFQRMLGEEGLEKFNEIMKEYLPGVTNLANPQREINQSLVQRFQLVVQGEEKDLDMTDIQTQFQGIESSEKFTQLHQAELAKIRDGLMHDLDNIPSAQKLLRQYERISLRNIGDNLIDLEIINLAMVVEIQIFLENEFSRHIPSIIPRFQPTDSSLSPEEKLQEIKDYLYRLSHISQVKHLFTRSPGGIYSFYNKKKLGDMFEKYFSSDLFYATDKSLSDNLNTIANRLQYPQMHLITQRRLQRPSITANAVPALAVTVDTENVRKQFDENLDIEAKKKIIKKTLQSYAFEFKEKSRLPTTTLGRLCFAFVRYDRSTKSDLKNIKTGFMEKIDELAALCKTPEEKIAIYNEYINSPVLTTHRNSGFWAIGKTKSQKAIADKITTLLQTSPASKVTAKKR